MELKACDFIPLKAIFDSGSLVVPTNLSRKTAFRPEEMGLISFVDKEINQLGRRGTVELTEIGINEIHLAFPETASDFSPQRGRLLKILRLAREYVAFSELATKGSPAHDAYTALLYEIEQHPE